MGGLASGDSYPQKKWSTLLASLLKSSGAFYIRHCLYLPRFGRIFAERTENSRPMLRFTSAKKLAKAGFKQPKRLRPGQDWYTPAGKPASVIKSTDPLAGFVLLDISTNTVVQYEIRELIYAPTADEILRAISKVGKHRLLGMQPGAKEFEVNGSNLHQYRKGRRAADILAKEFVAIVAAKA